MVTSAHGLPKLSDRTVLSRVRYVCTGPPYGAKTIPPEVVLASLSSRRATLDVLIVVGTCCNAGLAFTMMQDCTHLCPLVHECNHCNPSWFGITMECAEHTRSNACGTEVSALLIANACPSRVCVRW